ncbi:class I SAM-dependent RNA methyltransferase [Litoreibacter roseus]|uniref:RNA methyltransferase n=1 Tax=Litoreibacter roseus TaxID=2601869 RepID=A0A6N6JF17_9RHOB|nr:class I SAM-dependent RNA methyltransferase [Litoreibacter roseus]GFE64724.1 RNA methyltransferase [Litoreibacter roseus]
MTPVTIERLNHKGEGVALNTPPIPRVLPGEEVWPDGRVIKPSSERVAPPCRHFKSCGGCAVQHANDDFVARWKADVVRQGLAARGLQPPVHDTLTSPPRSRRRATLHGRRTKKGALIGFHGRASDTLVEIPDCQILLPEILAALDLFQTLTIRYGSRKGEVSFAVAVSDGGLDVDVRNAKAVEPNDLPDLGELIAQYNLARLAWDGEVVATRTPRYSIGLAQVAPPPGAFLQATQHGETTLQNLVLKIVGDAKQVLDLFSGCGTFSLPLAQTAEVWALEGDAALIDSLDKAWRTTAGLRRVTAETRDLFRRPVLTDEFRKADAVVIDPPRAGAEAQTRELAASNVPRIAAVSCNPITFARDAAILVNGGYSLDWVQPVDQFRWSSHVELAAQFSRT